jgi:hypothetical protein
MAMAMIISLLTKYLIMNYDFEDLSLNNLKSYVESNYARSEIRGVFTKLNLGFSNAKPYEFYLDKDEKNREIILRTLEDENVELSFLERYLFLFREINLNKLPKSAWENIFSRIVGIERNEALFHMKKIADLENSIEKEGFNKDYPIYLRLSNNGIDYMVDGGHHRLQSLRNLIKKGKSKLLYYEKWIKYYKREWERGKAVFTKSLIEELKKKAEELRKEIKKRKKVPCLVLIGKHFTNYSKINYMNIIDYSFVLDELIKKNNSNEYYVNFVFEIYEEKNRFIRKSFHSSVFIKNDILYFRLGIFAKNDEVNYQICSFLIEFTKKHNKKIIAQYTTEKRKRLMEKLSKELLKKGLKFNDLQKHSKKTKFQSTINIRLSEIPIIHKNKDGSLYIIKKRVNSGSSLIEKKSINHIH